MTRTLRTNNRHADNARRLLRHYLRTVATAAGVRWDGDMDAEVGDIVDSLLLAMWDEIENEADYRTQETAGDGDEAQPASMTDERTAHYLDHLRSVRR